LLRKFKVLLEHNEDEEGYTVTVPALPGCITEGNTVEEALENAREAITGFLEALRIPGKQLPKKEPRLLFGEVEVHDSPAP
jgi:antitoxin HicB